jgi:hypothetical protein
MAVVQHIKPVTGSELCMAPHQQYQLSGRIHVVFQDGRDLGVGTDDEQRPAMLTMSVVEYDVVGVRPLFRQGIA